MKFGGCEFTPDGELARSSSESHVETQVKLSRRHFLSSLFSRRRSWPASTVHSRLEVFMDDHFLLILADSQLPIGSFAYSSGLESASIHAKDLHVPSFLSHSLHSMASTSLPFLIAVYNAPSSAAHLDDLFDANTPCLVARRSSITQGRALLKLLDKTFLQFCSDDEESVFTNVKHYKKVISTSSSSNSGNVGSQGDDETEYAYGHFCVVFGLVGRVLKIDIGRLAYAFLQSHAKAVLSAAVRLSLIGPYESTHLLASNDTRTAIKKCITENMARDVTSAGQTFSMIDLWQGRHELLYSRIFSA